MRWIKSKLFDLGLYLIVKYEDYGQYDLELEDMLEEPCICDSCLEDHSAIA